MAVSLGETHGDCAKLLDECTSKLGASPGNAAAAAAPKLLTSDPPKSAEPRIKHSWYQTPTAVNVDIFIKKVDPKDASIEFTPTTLSVTVKLPSGADYSLELDLCYQILPDKSKFSIKGTKIEIKMTKKAQISWPDLKGEGLAGDEGAVAAMAVAGPGAVARTDFSQKSQSWTRLEKELEEQEKEEKPEGDAALNKLFQDIYKNGTPEQMRAMVKSYTESGGTVLSTNWDEIGKEKTEVKPPAGMEYREYEKSA